MSAGSWLDSLSDDEVPTYEVPEGAAEEAAGSRLSDASLAQLERLVEEQHRQVQYCSLHKPLISLWALGLCSVSARLWSQHKYAGHQLGQTTCSSY